MLKGVTDHKNLTYKSYNTERVMRWQIILEEFSPELIYIKGSKNIVSDDLSCLDKIDNVHNTNTDNNSNNNKVEPTLEKLGENFAYSSPH